MTAAADAGADAVLIGTALSAADDPEALARQISGCRAMAVEVKICGLTRPADAALAARLGAAYLGVVFAEGTRQVGTGARPAISCRRAAACRCSACSVHRRGDILRLRDRRGSSAVQLHGATTRTLRMQLARGGAAGLGGARIAGAGRPRPPAPDQADGADAVLVEPRVPGAVGGTGVALDLSLARAARARLGRHADGAGRRAHARTRSRAPSPSFVPTSWM